MAYYVYIIQCQKWKYSRQHQEHYFHSTIYYTGMTSNPKKRLLEHKQGIKSNWMNQNNIRPLFFVYMECVENYNKCLEREKKIKTMSQPNKIKLINEYNENT